MYVRHLLTAISLSSRWNSLFSTLNFSMCSRLHACWFFPGVVGGIDGDEDACVWLAVEERFWFGAWCNSTAEVAVELVFDFAEFRTVLPSNIEFFLVPGGETEPFLLNGEIDPSTSINGKPWFCMASNCASTSLTSSYDCMCSGSQHDCWTSVKLSLSGQVTPSNSGNKEKQPHCRQQFAANNDLLFGKTYMQYTYTRAGNMQYKVIWSCLQS